MANRSEELETDLRALIARFDELAKVSGDRPTVFLIGASALLLEGLIARATQDLDFICDQEGERFENQVLPNGLHPIAYPPASCRCPRAGEKEAAKHASSARDMYESSSLTSTTG